MKVKQKKELKRIIISAVLFLVVFLTDVVLKKFFPAKFKNGLSSVISDEYGFILPFVAYFFIYLYIGKKVLKKFFYNIKNGNLFDENFLMTVASFGAFALSIYSGVTSNVCEGAVEGLTVMLLYSLGEWFQSVAVDNSRKSISKLMDIRPDVAYLKTINGEIKKVEPSLLKVGDIIVVKPGEKIPVDGRVVLGASAIDTKAITGESIPKDVNINSTVVSGTINLTSVLEIKVVRTFKESTVSKILELVENVLSYKSKSENFINRFAKYYTPIIVTLSLIITVIPPFVSLIIGNKFSILTWIYRALCFLVVSCPCALVISVPLSFFSALGGASKKGILIKGSTFIEKMNKVNTFVFDKTGTVTEGSFKVTKVFPENRQEEILRLACICEKDSSHPIANSIKKSCTLCDDTVYERKEIAGKGIIAKGKDIIFCGNSKLLSDNGITVPKFNEDETVVYVGRNKSFIGYIVLSDSVKNDAFETFEYLNSFAKTVMLSGDNENKTKCVADKLSIKEYKSSLLPLDKANYVKELIEKNNGKVCFIGDGINDAPVLMLADVGIAMGKIGSDASIEASDIVFMQDKLTSLKDLKLLSKKTMRIVFENVVFSVFVKFLVLILSAFGISSMIFAVFGDVGVAFIAIINALRCKKIKG